MTPTVLSRNLLVFLFLLHVVAVAQPEPIAATVPVPAHPRLLLRAGQEVAIQQALGANKAMGQLHQAILTECDKLVEEPTLQRIQVGRRLLAVSRECLRREFYLAYAWRLTKQEKYRRRAEQELLAVAAFTDWNPSHFLDVAEMTAGVALGYDWLYQDLPESSRVVVREAILEKGLKPSLLPRNNGWLQGTNNWNQVCNAGMALGALAIYEDQPELARSLLNRAITTVVTSMRVYAPDGAYPEGYGYWSYGTNFNVLLISALENAFGQDFGLAKQPGFLNTARYFESMTGTSGRPFNYSDAGATSEMQPDPAMFWFAGKLKDPSLLWVERQNLANKQTQRHLENRLLPAVLLFGSKLSTAKITAPATEWVGGGLNPVALLRTSWTDPAAIFVGLKCGSPSVSHGHMDVGSFVLDADGVRWATDFGMQNYESLESKGVDLWGKQRWQVYRYTNQAHSTLTVNGQLQAVAGYAPLLGSSATPAFLSATTDLSKLYPRTLATARRGVAIVDRRYVTVRDELTAADTAATVRWVMLTPATVKLLNATTAELTQNGQKLLLQVTEPATVNLQTWSTTPPHDYDAPNPGTTLVGFEISMPAKSTQALTVLLVPGSASQQPSLKVLPLAQWPSKPTASKP